MMSSRKWQGRSLSPLDVALSPGSPVGCHKVIRPKDYALREHLWGELNYVLYSYAQKTLLPRKKKPCVLEDEEREAQARCLSPGRVIMTWSERHLYSPAVSHADLLLGVRGICIHLLSAMLIFYGEIFALFWTLAMTKSPRHVSLGQKDIFDRI